MEEQCSQENYNWIKISHLRSSDFVTKRRVVGYWEGTLCKAPVSYWHSEESNESNPHAANTRKDSPCSADAAGSQPHEPPAAACPWQQACNTSLPLLLSRTEKAGLQWSNLTIRRALVLEEQTCYSGHADSFNIMHISNYKEKKTSRSFVLLPSNPRISAFFHSSLRVRMCMQLWAILNHINVSSNYQSWLIAYQTIKIIKNKKSHCSSVLPKCC